MLLQSQQLWSVLSANADDSLFDKDKDNAARALICLSLSDHLLIHVQSASTAKETWLILKNLFSKNDQHNQILLLKQFLNFKKNSEDSVSSYLAKLKNLSEKLTFFQNNSSNKLLIAVTFNSLPSSYSSFISPLRMQGERFHLWAPYIFAKRDLTIAGKIENMMAWWNLKEKKKKDKRINLKLKF